MAEKDVIKLRQNIRDDLAQLNYDLNMVVSKFFNSLQKTLNTYDRYIGNTHAIIPGIDDFNVIVDLAEELYPHDKPFTTNMRSRKRQGVIIRQCCYLIGMELGLTYAHMTDVLNTNHGYKVSDHSTMVHGVRQTRNSLEIKDKNVLPIWSNLMAEMQKRSFKKTFVSLDYSDKL